MKPVARQGDRVVAIDRHRRGRHVVPARYVGRLRLALVPRVLICGRPAAVVGSVAVRGHSTPYSDHPDGRARVTTGSSRVFINGRPVARQGDRAESCGLDHTRNPRARVTASQGRVFAR